MGKMISYYIITSSVIHYALLLFNKSKQQSRGLGNYALFCTKYQPSETVTALENVKTVKREG